MQILNFQIFDILTAEVLEESICVFIAWKQIMN